MSIGVWMCTSRLVSAHAVWSNSNGRTNFACHDQAAQCAAWSWHAEFAHALRYVLYYVILLSACIGLKKANWVWTDWVPEHWTLPYVQLAKSAQAYWDLLIFCSLLHKIWKVHIFYMQSAKVYNLYWAAVLADQSDCWRYLLMSYIGSYWGKIL